MKTMIYTSLDIIKFTYYDCSSIDLMSEVHCTSNVLHNSITP